MDIIKYKKLRINCSVEQLVDVFFQLNNELSFDGKPLIDGNSDEIANVITDSFLDNQGNALDTLTIKTMLSSFNYRSVAYKVFIM